MNSSLARPRTDSSIMTGQYRIERREALRPTSAVMPSSEPPRPRSSGDSLTSIHIRQAIQNDRASVAWLVSRFTPLLLCQAQHRIAPALRSVCDADDAVSDVWM